MPQTIQKLNARHFKILEFCLRGWTNKHIAEHLNMSGEQVSIIVCSPSFQHELVTKRDRLDELTEQSIVSADDEVTKAIKAHTLAAVERLGIVSAGKDEDGGYASLDGVAVRASAEILDRGGYPRTQRTETKSLSILISPDDAKRIADTMEMERSISAQVV